jgi:hypothetical protein
MILSQRKVYEKPKGDLAVFLTVKKFSKRFYLDLREHYVDFEGEWAPTGKGITFPFNLTTVPALLVAIVELLSEEEIKAWLKEVKPSVNDDY